MRISRLAESMARPLGRRLAATEDCGTRSQLLAAVGRTSPLSMTKTAAHERWNDQATTSLPSAETSAFLRRLLITRVSVAGLVPEKESERMMPATGSIISIDP